MKKSPIGKMIYFDFLTLVLPLFSAYIRDNKKMLAFGTFVLCECTQYVLL